MEQKKINTTLEEDQLMVERLFSKEALANYDKSASSVPASYFETFPEKLQNRIANNKPKIFFLTPIGKMAIAAAWNHSPNRRAVESLYWCEWRRL